MDLDAVVSIERGRISLYPEPTSGSGDRMLPPPGQGLNQPALLTFRRMAVRRPDDKSSVEAFKSKLMEASTRMHGIFVHYDPLQGVWLLKLDSWQ